MPTGSEFQSNSRKFRVSNNENKKSVFGYGHGISAADGGAATLELYSLATGGTQERVARW